MVQVRFFTLLVKATGVEGYESSARTVEALLREVHDRYGDVVNRYLESCIVLVNGTNAGYLKGPRTKLRAGDVVSIFPPVAGG